MREAGEEPTPRPPPAMLDALVRLVEHDGPRFDLGLSVAEAARVDPAVNGRIVARVASEACPRLEALHQRARDAEALRSLARGADLSAADSELLRVAAAHRVQKTHQNWVRKCKRHAKQQAAGAPSSGSAPRVPSAEAAAVAASPCDGGASATPSAIGEPPSDPTEVSTVGWLTRTGRSNSTGVGAGSDDTMALLEATISRLASLETTVSKMERAVAALVSAKSDGARPQ